VESATHFKKENVQEEIDADFLMKEEVVAVVEEIEAEIKEVEVEKMIHGDFSLDV